MGVHLRFTEVPARRWGTLGAPNGKQGGAPASPDRGVLRSYRLRAVLGLGDGGQARGVSGLNGESSTLRGLLGTHVQAPGRSARGVAVRPLPGRWATPSPRSPLGLCSPAGSRGRSQAGGSCPSPGRGRTLRSRRSRAGVCGAPGLGCRGGELHCDPGSGALTSQSPFPTPGNLLPPLHSTGAPRSQKPEGALWRSPWCLDIGLHRSLATRWGRGRHLRGRAGPAGSTQTRWGALPGRARDSLPGPPGAEAVVV